MNEQELKKLSDLLKQSLTPVDRELNRDLWPKMLRRLDHDSSHRHWVAVLFSASALSSVPWFDWALLLVLAAGVVVFRKTIPIWLYHI